MQLKFTSSEPSIVNVLQLPGFKQHINAYPSSTVLWYYAIMLKKKHKMTLNAVFARPVRSGIVWDDIEALLQALGAEISEGSGSRVRLVLNGRKAVFHRPHPRKETDKGALASMKRFLTEAGVKPC